jgi:hypothetical protein
MSDLVERFWLREQIEALPNLAAEWETGLEIIDRERVLDITPPSTRSRSGWTQTRGVQRFTRLLTSIVRWSSTTGT